MTDYTQILYNVADQIATITINRPEKMNAFTGTMTPLTALMPMMMCGLWWLPVLAIGPFVPVPI